MKEFKYVVTDRGNTRKTGRNSCKTAAGYKSSVKLQKVIKQQSAKRNLRSEEGLA